MADIELVNSFAQLLNGNVWLVQTDMTRVSFLVLWLIFSFW